MHSHGIKYSHCHIAIVTTHPEHWTIALQSLASIFFKLYALERGVYAHEGRCLARPKLLNYPGVGVAGICKMPELIAGNKTQVLCGSRASSSALTISPTPTHSSFLVQLSENTATLFKLTQMWEFGAIAGGDKGKGVRGGNRGRSPETQGPIGVEWELSIGCVHWLLYVLPGALGNVGWLCLSSCLRPEAGWLRSQHTYTDLFPPSPGSERKEIKWKEVWYRSCTQNFKLQGYRWGYLV